MNEVSQGMTISIVLPCFNEALNIETTVAGVSEWLRSRGHRGEIIAVDDGSTDDTGSILRDLTVRHMELRVVTHETNRGYGSAVRSGCDGARSEWVGFMDSDGQFRAGDFDRLTALTRECDFVTGRRIQRADPPGRRVTQNAYMLLVFLVLGIWVRDINCAMKLFRKSIWTRIQPVHSTGASVNAEIFYRLSRQGIRWRQVPVTHYPRVHGRQTGASPSVVLRSLRELIAIRRRRA